MKIYVAMVCDRHTDPEPHLFTDPDDALDFAHEEALKLARHEDFLTEEVIAGRLYSATCGEEGDEVWVLAKELDGRAPK